MIILTRKKSLKEKSDWVVHVSLGEVGFAVDAPTREDAARIALERAEVMVTRGTCSINIPKIVRINGSPYSSPPNSVRIANHIN
jgi:hypothetical protein